MAEIINFNKFLLNKRTKDVFKDWNNRFGCSLKDTARIRDLPNSLLLALAEGGSEGNLLLDKIIMKVWGIERGPHSRLAVPGQVEVAGPVPLFNGSASFRVHVPAGMDFSFEGS